MAVDISKELGVTRDRDTAMRFRNRLTNEPEFRAKFAAGDYNALKLIEQVTQQIVGTPEAWSAAPPGFGRTRDEKQENMVEYQLMRIIDLTNSIEGHRYYLMADGTILSRDTPRDFDHQHLAPENRPQWRFNKIAGPGGKVTKIVAGHQFDLEVIADGKVFRRVRDVTSMAGDRFKWQEVDLV